jgi:LmbE family N-acetylglucosaminyl deacetylase
MAGGSQPGTSLFVLAHQDDELCAAPIIASTRAGGHPVCVVYMTDGGAGRASPARRDRESLRALEALGVAADEVIFLGSRHRFPDGAIYKVLPQALAALRDVARAVAPVSEIFTLAYEGGHQDHDTTHALAVRLSAELGLLESTRQIPFYRAVTAPGLPVGIWAPLPENGPVTYLPINAAARLRSLSLIRMYPSQWRVLLLLGPLLAWAYAVRPGVPLQPVSLERLKERRAAGPLFYERHGKIGFAEVASAISRLFETSSY